MTPDPKEAAIQRLSSAFGSYLETQGDPPITYSRLDELARIAIEQAVEPVADRIMAVHVHADEPIPFPWDSVCADSAKQEKVE